MDIENVLMKISLRSPYYVKLFALLLFSGATSAMYSVQYLFVVSDVPYRCKDVNSNADISNLNFTTDNRCNVITQFNAISNDSFSTINKTTTCTEWIYEDEATFFGELNLGCQDWKRFFVASVHGFGYMIGLLIMGPLSDKIGRKKLIIGTGLVAAVMGLGRSVVQSYWIYITLELIEAMFGDTYSPTYMMGVEMVTKENRVIFIGLMTVVTSTAGSLMAVIAWAVPYWRNFLRVIYVPSLLFLLYAFLLDESLRWLLITGRKNEAIKIIKRAAEINHMHICEEESNDCDRGTNKNMSMKNIIIMTVSSKKLVLRFGACVCLWMTVLFNKYTLLINSVELEGNKYINFGLTKFSELPAGIALFFILKRFKRTKPLLCSFVLTGVFCISQSFVPKGHVILSTTLFLFGNFLVSISLEIVYLYTSELFPTYIRNTMHSLCSSLGRTVSILGSQTPLLMAYWRGLPSLLIGILSLVTGLIVIMMPDTAEEVLPDTVKEAEKIVYRRTEDSVEVTVLGKLLTLPSPASHISN